MHKKGELRNKFNTKDSLRSGMGVVEGGGKVDGVGLTKVPPDI